MNSNITAELMAVAKQLARIAARIDVERIKQIQQTEKQEQQATDKQIKYTSIKLNSKTFKI